MDEMTRRVRAYIVHDAESNMEGYVSDYSAKALQEAQDAGLIIIAEYNDGSRKRVDAADVVEPQPEMNGVTLVQPVYVDERMEAVVAVFDALAAVAAPAPMILASEGAPVDAPPPAFADALAALKALVFGGEAAR